jgi:hypothetical protein
LIEKAYGNEAKNNWVGCAPEPKVLMQEVENHDCDYKQYSFHTFRCLVFDVKADLQLTKQ